jgi:hypothetical protein
MNSLEFQKKLSDAWLELIVKRKEDKNFIEKQAGIKAYDKYWFTLDQKNLPGVIINLDQGIEFNIANFPKAKGWVFNKVKNKIIMNINDERYKDFFLKLITLILSKIHMQNLTGKESTKCFLENLISAKDFFEDDDAPRKLTKESQIGLYGEVFVLSKILTKKLDNEGLINSWTGPSKKHDFTTEKILIEIKTTTTNSKKINTSSNNQIAPVFDKALNIIFLQIKNSSNGFSLVDVINNYLTILKTESEILHNDFLLKLAQCNYLDVHKDEYTEKYEIDKTNYFEVRDDFPYIKKVEIPEELSDLTITYKIDLEKCEDFRINEEQLLSKI